MSAIAAIYVAKSVELPLWQKAWRNNTRKQDISAKSLLPGFKML